jgi:hypothetical protein
LYVGLAHHDTPQLSQAPADIGCRILEINSFYVERTCRLTGRECGRACLLVYRPVHAPDDWYILVVVTVKEPVEAVVTL